MIETEQQRRWWFATHPEYSRRSSGRRGKHGAKDGSSGKLDPEKVDSWADSRLKYEKDPVAAELLKQAKFWFGTEFASKPPGEKHALLAEEKPVASDALFKRRSSKYSDPDWFRRFVAEEMERWNNSDWMLDAIPGGSGLKFIAGSKVLQKVVRGKRTKDAVVNAVKERTTEGPGRWVEVRRGKYGLEHQSKMSGQPIRKSEGKYYIKEYEVNGVKFDDYRDGALREYKGNYLNFIVKKAREFYQWFKGAKSARNQALRQAEAAQGVPVKWHVGPPNQVGAFRKAVGKVPGVTIEP